LHSAKAFDLIPQNQETAKPKMKPDECFPGYRPLRSSLIEGAAGPTRHFSLRPFNARARMPAVFTRSSTRYLFSATRPLTSRSTTRFYRLDALDAFNQKLVKKIGVRGISVKGQAGASAYLYIQSIEVSTDKPPQARVEMEIRQDSGIARKLRLLTKGDNLHAKPGELDQYQGYVVADICRGSEWHGMVFWFAGNKGFKGSLICAGTG
jgi:hypothetical protein